MASDELRSMLVRLKEETWRLARMSLDEGQTRIYRSLVEMTERLASLGGKDGYTNSSHLDGVESESESGLVSIFDRFKGDRHEARFNGNRVNGGRGNCVFFRGQWLTASAAARLITNTQINGWRFWRYLRGDGTMGVIEELR